MLQTQTVEPITFSLLKELMQLDEFKSFCLVGGTAMSLKYGHRKSNDLDLFSNESFDHNIIINSLAGIFSSRFEIENQNTKWGIFCYINNIKVDIVYYPHPVIKEFEQNEGIRIYSSEDIIAMKINAILGRGKKKDFYDLSELFNHFTLEDMIAFHKQKFPSQNLLISIPQSLVYFDDAEESEAPISLKGQTWETVKKHIQEKVNEFLS